MTTTLNGTTATPALPTIEPYDPRAELDAWEDGIAAMDAAMRDAAGARREIDELSTLLERLEASKVLTVEGKNAEERKARLTLELADDARYRGALADLRAARERLADADRRVLVSRERCRLLRAALALGLDA
jgi:hypothetical protein